MKINKRPNKHRLSMDIPDNLFEILKNICEEKETTITKFVLGAIVRRIKLESDKKI